MCGKKWMYQVTQLQHVKALSQFQTDHFSTDYHVNNYINNKQKLANVISEEFQTLRIILQLQSQYK